MSKYQEELQKLENSMCQTCQGSGEMDDAEPGDIFYNTYNCCKCGGSGFNPLHLKNHYFETPKDRDTNKT